MFVWGRLCVLCLYVTLTLSADEGTCYGDKDKGCSREQSSGIFVTRHSWERYLNLINTSLVAYRECEEEGCTCYEGVLDKDLRPWREEGITWKDFKAAREYAPRAVHYQIFGHKLYRQKDCMFEYRCKGIEHFLLQVARDLPDVEFLVNTFDHPVVPRSSLFPIFSFSKTSSYADIMYPAWSFWAGGPAIFMEPMGLGRWDLKRDTISRAAAGWPWGRKLPVAFFRGSRTSSDRDPLILYSRAHPLLVDAAYTKNQAWKSDLDTLGEPAAVEVGLAEHCKYRYLFNFRGVAASFRLRHLFLCKSLVFHVGSEWAEFFYPLMQPWVHYIPVDQDMEGIGDLLEFVRANDQLVEGIAQRGYELIWKHLKMDDISCYWRQLLMRYARLARWKVIREPSLQQIVS